MLETDWIVYMLLLIVLGIFLAAFALIYYFHRRGYKESQAR
jgi:hypothetical protein